MAEEVNHATVVIPRAILLSVAINGTLGFTMLIATLFCMGSVDAALESPTGYPFMEIFQQATGSVAGGLGLSSILVIVGICAALAMLTATSRQFWSFARDRGVPGWRVWSHVCPANLLPHTTENIANSNTGLQSYLPPHLLHPPHHDRLLSARSD